MQQFLKPAERTQKSADKTPKQNTEQDKNPSDIIRKTEFRRPDDSLKRTDWTGTGGRRTGITIQSRHADNFSSALINATLQEIWQMNIREQCRPRLNQTAGGRQPLRYTLLLWLIQFQHTPDTAELPCQAR